jgi:translation initiation factor 1
MSKKKITNTGGGFVFSTNPDFRAPESDDEPAPEAPVNLQPLRIWLQRLKGNKEATVIKGYSGPDDQLEEIARTLKTKCATGGNAKDGEIILQGDHRDKVLALLLGMGFTKAKKAGG